MLLGVLFTSLVCTAQAKKPTIMVVPSDVWCDQYGFMTEYDNHGTKVRVADYKSAIQKSSDLLAATAKINELMAARGFPLKDLEAALKTLENESAEDAMLTSKTSGAEISESSIDKLKKVAKADIIIQMTWKVNTIGFKKSVTFTLKGIDAYTDKNPATISGTGNELSGAPLAVLLESAVLGQIDNFNVQLMAHFDDMFANGREIVLRVKKFESFDGDLESEYNGEELGVLIEQWVSSNTVKGRFNSSEATENIMLFEQVRIPLLDSNNKAIDARAWGRGLQKYLKSSLQIESKVMMKGLGQVTIVVGEK